MSIAAGALAGVAVPAILAALVPPPARAAFERAATGPRAAALGGLLATSVEPAFGNPAPPIARAGPARDGGRLGVAAPRAAVWSARPFGLAGLREWQAGAALPGPLSLGAGLRRFGSDAYAEREARLVVGLRPVDPLAVGVAVRGLEVAGTGFAPRRSAALDAGVRVRAAPDLVLAATVEALVGEVPGDPGGRLRRTALGAIRTAGPLRLCLEAVRREDGPLTALGGVAFTPVPALTLRLGAGEEPARLSAGATLRAGAAAVSVAASRVPPLGVTVRVGVELARAPPGSGFPQATAPVADSVG